MAENARLRSELAGARGAALGRGVRFAVLAATLVLDAVLFTFIVRWINAPSDRAVYLGLGGAVALVGLNVVVALRVLRRG